MIRIKRLANVIIGKFKSTSEIEETAGLIEEEGMCNQITVGASCNLVKIPLL